jgi:glutamine synthetase
MAEELAQFADELEGADDFETALQKLVCRTFTEHQRIIFNGNGYSQEWQDEAARRGLSNMRSTAECMPSYISKKNIDLVSKHGIFSEAEFRARYAIHMETYCKMVNIEARTSADMVMHQILPAAIAYCSCLCDTVNSKKQLGVSAKAEEALITRLSNATDNLYASCEKLKQDLSNIPTDIEKACSYYGCVIVNDMADVRKEADILEQLTDKKYWPYPTYSDLLFY